MEHRDPDDPKGLIREAYRIDGIGQAECRSILVDWAISLPVGTDTAAVAARLRERALPADHPMTALLGAASAPATLPPGRRGGRAARLSSPQPA